jgi:hypothetical protein
MNKFILFTDIPRWYHLFWNRQLQALCISIHRFFLENCKRKDFAPYFRHLQSEPERLPLFDTYEAKLGQGSFGINNRIRLIEQNDQWVTYKIEISSMISVSDSVCTSCRGKIKRHPQNVYNEECHSCEGTGKETVFDFNKIGEISSSLAVFLNALQFPIEEGDADTPHKQLFTLTSGCEWRAHGHSVGGYASPEFLRFLESMSDSYDKMIVLPSVVKVMKHVHQIIYGKVHKFDRFSCYTRRGQIILDSPGDACQIHTEPDRAYGSGAGDSITCHNLDTGMQQLMLLSGMGELASLYEDWIVTNPKL